MLTNQQTCIFQVNGANPTEEPRAGYFAVLLGKNKMEQALLVRKYDIGPHWVVFLNGTAFGFPVMNWGEAFGPLFQFGQLYGREVFQPEYEKILRGVLRAKSAGVDLHKPLDLNKAEPPFAPEKT